MSPEMFRLRILSESVHSEDCAVLWRRIRYADSDPSKQRLHHYTDSAEGHGTHCMKNDTEISFILNVHRRRTIHETSISNY